MPIIQVLDEKTSLKLWNEPGPYQRGFTGPRTTYYGYKLMRMQQPQQSFGLFTPAKEIDTLSLL